MMNKDEFKVIIKAMKSVYTDPKFLPDADAWNVWFALLGDLPYAQVNIAVQKYMLTEKFPPTIADIRSAAIEVIDDSETDMSELEAWAYVRKAMSNSLYNSQSEFNRLPMACQKAVGDPSVLKDWAMADEMKLTQIEQRFAYAYRSAVERIKQDAKMPPAIKKQISELTSHIGSLGIEQKRKDV